MYLTLSMREFNKIIFLNPIMIFWLLLALEENVKIRILSIQNSETCRLKVWWVFCFVLGQVVQNAIRRMKENWLVVPTYVIMLNLNKCFLILLSVCFNQQILWHRFSIWKISKTNTIKFSSCHGPQKIKF